MKTIGFLLTIFLVIPPALADRFESVKIGDSTAIQPKALLEVKSTVKGLLGPRMSQAQRDAISSPPAGLEIFNTTTNKKNVFNGTAWVELASNIEAMNLSNKILIDSTTSFGNVSDTSKQSKWSLGGATTGKTLTLSSSHTNDRTLTLPDATDTVAALGVQQTFTNKILSDLSVSFGNDTDATKQAKWSLGGATTAKTITLLSNHTNDRTLTFPDVTDTLAVISSQQTFSNKILTDSNVVWGNISDLTKQAKWSLGGATTAKTLTLLSSHTDDRTITIPDSTDTMAVLSTQQTFTNKIFSDSTVAWGNVGDTTKQAKWSLGGATTAKTLTLSSSHTNDRTINFPDVPGFFHIVSISTISSNTTATPGTTYLVDTSGGAVTVTLPAASQNFYFIVKDKAGSFSTNNCTIARAGTEKIENLSSNKILSGDWGAYTFISDGTDWFVF
ncbi:MAG: hypothetical protein SGI74_12885 [Oligoflexia bacterium]|nr:hypothetical protein [Oligoflexia bacterium]